MLIKKFDFHRWLFFRSKKNRRVVVKHFSVDSSKYISKDSKSLKLDFTQKQALFDYFKKYTVDSNVIKQHLAKGYASELFSSVAFLYIQRNFIISFEYFQIILFFSYSYIFPIFDRFYTKIPRFAAFKVKKLFGIIFDAPNIIGLL